MKTFNLSVIVLVLISIVSTNSFGQKKKNGRQKSYDWFSFKWYADSVSGRYFEKLAIVTPVEINNLKGNFVTQFDLGSDATTLYGGALKNYFPSAEALKAYLDTTKRSTSDAGVINYKTKNMTMKIGNHTMKDLLFSENFGNPIHVDSLYTNSEKHVGTVGANLTRDKVLIIDYPNKKMCLLDSIDNYWASKADFVTCRVKNNRIQLPFTINGSTNWIMFDSGASIFPLFTNKENWSNLVDAKGEIDTLKANSWGEKVNFYGALMTADVYLGKHKLNKAKAYYTENRRLLDFNKNEGIAGTTGNAYFFNDVVIIDFKNKRFGIAK
jgi:hypothetical protein